MTEESGVVLKCGCCQHQATFPTLQAAHEAGWDAPPYFTTYVSCDLCPSSLQVLHQTDRHAAAHDRWKVYGRPTSFTEQFRWGDLPTRPNQEPDRRRDE